MLRIAKRTLFISKPRLEDYFNLPEGVEILDVKKTKEGFEFQLVSAGEVFVGDRQITIVEDDEYAGGYRRISLDVINASQKKAEKENGE